MKRLFSITLALIMMLAFPLNAYAAAEETHLEDELLELACQIFPEYALTIQRAASGNLPRSSLRETPHVIINKTRAVNENRELTYVQMSNDSVYIVDGQFSAEVENITTDTGTPSVTTYFCDFSVTCAQGSQNFKIDDFSYRIYPSDFDVILKFGTPYFEKKYATTKPGDSTFSEEAKKTYENSAGKACLSYYLAFEDMRNNGVYYDATFNIEIGENHRTISLDSKVG